MLVGGPGRTTQFLVFAHVAHSRSSFMPVDATKSHRMRPKALFSSSSQLPQIVVLMHLSSLSLKAIIESFINTFELFRRCANMKKISPRVYSPMITQKDSSPTMSRAEEKLVFPTHFFELANGRQCDFEAVLKKDRHSFATHGGVGSAGQLLYPFPSEGVDHMMC